MRQGFDLHAPHLLDVKVVSALRRVAVSGHASADRAGAAVVDLLELRSERYPHDVLVPRAWELRDSFSTYDATYIAPAESVADERVPRITADARLARAARKHVSVILVD